MDWMSVIMLAQVMLSFLLLFVVLPSLFIRFDEGDDTLLDRLFIPLIHSSVFVSLTVYLLASVKLLETLSMIGVSMLAALVLVRRRLTRSTGSTGGAWTSLLTAIYDLADSRAGFKRNLVQQRAGVIKALRLRAASIVRPIKSNPIALTAILLALAGAAYVRFRHALTHYYFGASDAYVHLKWTKSVLKNTLFVDGVYAYGYQTLLAGLSRFFMLDVYNIFRFIGAIGGLLIVLSVAYAVRKFGSNLYGVFAAVFAYGTIDLLPTMVWRQLSALPMEYAMIFFLPGIAFWTLYCRHGQKNHLLLAAECLLLTVLIHPFTAISHAIAIIVIGLAHLPGLWKRKGLVSASLYLFVAGAVGAAPPLIGLALGVKLFGGEYVKQSVLSSGTGSAGGISGLIGGLDRWDYAILGFIGLSAVLVVTLFVRRRSRLQQPSVGFPTVLVLAVSFWVLYKAEKLGLPAVLPAARLGAFYSLVAALLIGVALLTVGRVVDRSPRKPLITGMIGLLAAALLLAGGFTLPKPEGNRYQYDEAVQTYLRIRGEIVTGDWTIVSPVDEFPLVEAYGWHMNLWEFVRDAEPGSGTAPGLPTSNVFFYVETIPLEENTPTVTADARKPFPVFTKGDLSAFYYKGENRRILEAKMYRWVQWYMRKYPDKMTLYADTPNLKVYRLKQEARIPPVKLPVLPREAEGVW